MFKLVLGTNWLVSQKYISRRHLQIVAGRWFFVLQFRRPAMCVLQKVWKLIGKSERISPKLRAMVRGELLQLVMMAPLLHCNLGASIEPHVVATVASQRGCAVASSCQLSPEGMDFLQAATKNEVGGVTAPQPILIVSLFNGIGGAFRSYDKLGCLPMWRVAVDCDAGASRVCVRRWPGTIFITDVKDVTRSVVRNWSRQFLQVDGVPSLGRVSLH